jgi:hypothetical protein
LIIAWLICVGKFSVFRFLQLWPWLLKFRHDKQWEAL